MTSEGRVLAVKQLRRELDAVLQTMRKIPGSREVSLAITKLQESIMWLGMDLKAAAGGQTCYEHGYDQTPTVEPTADGLKM